MPFKSVFKCCTETWSGQLSINNDPRNISQHNLVSHVAGMDGYDPLSENIYDNNTVIFRTVSDENMPDFEHLDNLSKQSRQNVQNEYVSPRARKEMENKEDTKHLKISKKTSLKRLLFGDSVVQWCPNEKKQSEITTWYGMGEVAGIGRDDFINDDRDLHNAYDGFEANCNVCECVHLKSCCTKSNSYTVTKPGDEQLIQRSRKKPDGIISGHLEEGKNYEWSKKRRSFSLSKRKPTKQKLKKTISDSGCCAPSHFSDSFAEVHNNCYNNNNTSQYFGKDIGMNSVHNSPDENIYEEVVVHYVKIGDSKRKVHKYSNIDLETDVDKDKISKNSEDKHLQENGQDCFCVTGLEKESEETPKEQTAVSDEISDVKSENGNLEDSSNEIMIDKCKEIEISSSETKGNMRDLSNKPDKSLIPKRTVSLYTPRKKCTTSSFWRKNKAKRSKSLTDNYLVDIDLESTGDGFENETFELEVDTKVISQKFFLNNISDRSKTDISFFIENNDSDLEFLKNTVNENNEYGFENDSIGTCSLELDDMEVTENYKFDDFMDEFDRKLSWLYLTQVLKKALALLLENLRIIITK